MTMIAMGGAIGTGLFLGSGMAVGQAGPGVIVSYLLGVGICLIMMYALAEMAVVHPTAGSFGVYAETYLNPWAGFVVRYTYWFAQVVAVGGEVTAAGIYTQFWVPGVSLWIWVVRLLGRAHPRQPHRGPALRRVRVLVRDDQGLGDPALRRARRSATSSPGFGAVAPVGLRNLVNPATGGFLPHGWRAS